METKPARRRRGRQDPAKKRATCRQPDYTGWQQLCPNRQQQKIRRHPPPRRTSRARSQNQPPRAPLSPHQRQQPTPTRRQTPNPRHRHRRPQKRTLTIKKRTIKCRPFLVALFATPFHFFHPAPSPIIPLLPIYLIIPIYLSHWVSPALTKLGIYNGKTASPRYFFGRAGFNNLPDSGNSNIWP